MLWSVQTQRVKWAKLESQKEMHIKTTFSEWEDNRQTENQSQMLENRRFADQIIDWNWLIGKGLTTISAQISILYLDLTVLYLHV